MFPKARSPSTGPTFLGARVTDFPVTGPHGRPALGKSVSAILRTAPQRSYASVGENPRHFASASTTDVSIWRSGIVQYRLRSRSFSPEPTN